MQKVEMKMNRYKFSKIGKSRSNFWNYVTGTVVHKTPASKMFPLPIRTDLTISFWNRYVLDRNSAVWTFTLVCLPVNH